MWALDNAAVRHGLVIPCEDRGIGGKKRRRGKRGGLLRERKRKGGWGVEEVDRVDGTALPIGDECWGSLAYSVGPKGLSHSLTEWK